MSKKLYLIDGSGFIFRAYFALPPLTRADGVNVGAVYGFCNILLKLQQDLIENNGDNYMAVIFDAGRKTFRNDIYPEYKAHRPEAPEDLIPQFPIFRQACQAFEIPSIEMINYEADDVIATYARLAKEQNLEVIIVSSDKDLMQLIGDGISLYDPIKNTPIGHEHVGEKFGVTPDKVVDVLALWGDSSDNVPGVPGIGPKTAALLVNQFGSLENIFDNLDQIPQEKRREVLKSNKELALISKKLVVLDDCVPIVETIENLKIKKPDQTSLLSFLENQNFKKIITRLKPDYFAQVQPNDTKTAPKLTPAVTASYETIRTIQQLENWLEKASQARVIAVDTETTSLNTQMAQLVGISMCYSPGHACYIPLNHKSPVQKDYKPTLSFDEPIAGNTSDQTQDLTQIPFHDAINALLPILNNSGIAKVGHNIKYDLAVLKKYGVNITPIHDTMLMSYVLEANLHGHGLDELARLHFDHQTIPFSQVAGTGAKQITFDYVPIDQASQYAAEDADYTLRLFDILKPQLAFSKCNTVYEYLERPLIPILVEMEARGIKVDVSVLKELSQEFAKRLQVLEEKIYQAAGVVFNIGSPKQLGEILFGALKLPSAAKTKTGGFSTDVDTLNDLALQGFEIADLILEWRGLSKLQSTYIDGLSKAINPKTGRVHTSYSMAGTSTGRLASSDPNLQNIPVRTADGRKIRKAFIAAPGKVLLSVDYSQIELRLLAHVAQIPDLITAFKNGEDIHKVTASQLFQVGLDQVTSDQRREAKTINFGIIYGISAYGLAQQLKIPTGRANDYIKAYFKQYPGIENYMESMKDFARKHGYVLTPWMRAIHTPDINSKNAVRRQAAERQAINAPLQGGNADIIKKSMIKLHENDLLQTMDAQLLLQVHDELIFEVNESLVSQAASSIKNVMENVVSLSVPLIIDSNWAPNWGDIK